ncbi:chromate resistance protein [Achromobacter sp. SD115]|uniref:chromate resistance protein ChrB domain-containing protein n=1 Tax=Achromobacter sp. SD115 TaxID=2782011 RepID=UPI001A96FEF1|nr:chromate resistance protein ChrB domain-containing protein [Achromobacter sp. SD115]MBO1016931.1 chromate resistance protein [Achromobacter sp. SD115]
MDTPLASSWLLLIVSLPTNGATARMRIWRKLKALGCAALRDGAYLLPAHAEQALQLTDLAAETSEEGGQAWLLRVQSQDNDESASFRVLFDRSADYDVWLAELAQARQTLAELKATELNRLLRRYERSYQALRRIDFFPAETSLRAQAQQRDFANAIESLLSPGEPHASGGGIARRDPMNHRGRLWATRRHIWVDRVACAWLIQRFIDPSARFLWLETPADCPADALGFDFDGATFTHVGDRVSFEVLLASFGLEENRGLALLGTLVHALDVGGATVPEAAGFEAILAGARKRLSDDDALLLEACTVLDSLYAHFSGGRKT